MIDLYYWPTPNGHKITLFLEEAGLDYRIVPVDIGKGAQFAPEFLAISPNNKMPAIIDHAPGDGGAPISVFESGAILRYLAEKTGRFDGEAFAAWSRTSCNNFTWSAWMLFISGRKRSKLRLNAGKRVAKSVSPTIDRTMALVRSYSASILWKMRLPTLLSATRMRS